MLLCKRWHYYPTQHLPIIKFQKTDFFLITFHLVDQIETNVNLKTCDFKV
jgi:hypothetical protein